MKPLEKAKINFFADNVSFVLPQKHKVKQWLITVAIGYHYKIAELNFIFCTDDCLLEINRKFLQHDTLTDIITFDNTDTELKNKLRGEIYISIDRVKQNAKEFRTTFINELHRVMVHGVLHLCGFKDKTKEQKEIIRAKENEALLLLC